MRTFGTMSDRRHAQLVERGANKRCITLDLRKRAGLAIAKRLVAAVRHRRREFRRPEPSKAGAWATRT